jgi:cobalt-zinc-cadmium efflux system outer membrane protein
MRPLKKKIASENLEATKAKVAFEVVTLVADVKKAFITVQADQETLESMKRNQEALVGSLDLAKRQREAGNVTELALLGREQQCQEGQLALGEAETLLAEHREDLNALLGLDGEQTRWKITSVLPRERPTDLSERDLLKLAEHQRFDLQAAYREARVHAVALKLTESFRWVPVLDFGVIGERDIDYAFNAGPAFRIELPIFNQGQSRLLREQSLLRRSVAKLQGLTCSIRSQVRKDTEKLRLLRERLSLYEKEILPTAKNITRASLDQYNAMQLSPYDLFQARYSEFSAEKEYETTLKDYWLARADLERAVGGTFRIIPDATKPFGKPTRSNKKS